MRDRYTTHPLRRALFWVSLLVLVALAVPAGQSPSLPPPPPTRTVEVVETLHGVRVPDPYRWLEEDQAPEVRAWIDAQNAYTRSLLDPQPTRPALRALLGKLLERETMGSPTVRNGHYFFFKRTADQALSVLYVRRGLRGREEALIDPHPLSPDHSISLTLLDVAEDASLVVYGLRRGGEDEIELRLFDVRNRRNLTDRIERGRLGSVRLLPDNSGFYYTRFTPEGTRVYFHKLGTDPAADPVIFGEGLGREKTLACSLSDDGRWLAFLINEGSASRKTEIYLQDRTRGGPPVPLVQGIEARFSLDWAGPHLYLLTNWNAPNGRLLRVELERPEREHWQEVIPESGAVLQNVSAVGGRLFASYLRNVVSELRIFDAAGKPLGAIRLPALGVVSGMSGRWSSPEGFYSFSSLAHPPTTYRYDVATGRTEVWFRQQVPLRSQQYEVKQVWYTSKDGTRVPMFVAHRRGIRFDGSHPTLLHGYGGFNVSQLPSYSTRAAAWLELGGVYALANLRGGSEFGESWHRAGMLENKQNVFDDFIAAAEWLIANRYTRPDKLAISGGSNGGLLVGAALTQRPDLFRAVLCFYPLLDMVRYHKFSIARFWVPEYGSAEHPEQFRYLYAYSPYHNVKEGTKYPAVMIVTGDADTRVVPLHACKMVARLQAANASDRPILLRYDTRAGHVGGGTPIPVQIEELTDQLSFLLWQLGVVWPPQPAPAP
jgi:prolyl oligopeptidase